MIEKDIQQLRIEAAGAIAHHDVNRSVHRKCRPIYTIPGEGVKDIRHRGDACFHRNVTTAATVWIPIPVPTLVMIQSDRRGKLKNRADRALQEGVAQLAVPLDDRSLVRGQALSFVQHPIRNADFADIVQRSREAHGGRGIDRESAPLRKCRRGDAEPLDVSTSVIVAKHIAEMRCCTICSSECADPDATFSRSALTSLIPVALSTTFRSSSRTLSAAACSDAGGEAHC